MLPESHLQDTEDNVDEGPHDHQDMHDKEKHDFVLEMGSQCLRAEVHVFDERGVVVILSQHHIGHHNVTGCWFVRVRYLEGTLWGWVLCHLERYNQYEIRNLLLTNNPIF